MICKKRIAVFVFFLLSLTINHAQTIGQTKAYLIKQNETCKIVQNTDLWLVLNCDGLEQVFTFDEDKLCKVHFFELLVSDWNSMQVEMLKGGSKYVGKSVAPLIKGKNETANVLIYSDDKFDFFFYLTDFDGNEAGDIKSVSVRKHI